MFTSFDENTFNEAIKNKDYLTLKVNTVSAILNDPTFSRGEARQVIAILKKYVPDIFEDEARLEYEERIIDKKNWDKRYFTKLTYWLQENFALTRIDYIEEVGKAVHGDTEEKYRESMKIESMKNTSVSKKRNNNKIDSHSFLIVGVIVAVVALVIVILIIKLHQQL